MDKPVSRVTRPKEEARRYYNSLSRWYDLVAGSSEEKYRQTGMALLAIQPGERVLEIGFGTGGCLAAFAQATGPSGFVCGIELSDGMAAIARHRLSDVRGNLQAGIVLADGSQPPFGPGCFDAIFMSFTLELFDTPDIVQALRRCRHILHPRGRLGVVSLVKTKDPGMAERIYEWFHAHMPVAVDCRPIDAQTALQRTGFAIERVIHESMWGLPVESILGRNTTL